MCVCIYKCMYVFIIFVTINITADLIILQLVLLIGLNWS